MSEHELAKYKALELLLGMDLGLKVNEFDKELKTLPNYENFGI